jgi:ribosomal 30S subunit maturation factor RimM
VTGANDVYVVTHQDGKQVLLPAIESVILAINPGKKEMLVHLIPGLV